MTFNSATHDEQHHLSSAEKRSVGAEAGEPRESYLLRRLARKYWIAVGFGIAVPPLIVLASILPLTLSDALIVTTAVSAVLIYILTILTELHTLLKTAKCIWEEREDSIAELQDRYAELYAAYIEQRGAVSLLAERKRGAAADPSGASKESAAVIYEFPTDGAA